MLRNLTLLAAFFLLILSSWNLGAAPQERIKLFSSYIQIQKNATLEINEVISLYSAQDRIRHAIVRRFPLNYIDSYGVRHQTNYQVQQVLINNVISPFSTKIIKDHFIIYAGNPDAILPPGTYTFTLRYQVKDANNFLPNQDELYWNITGKGWDFPIEKVEASVELPEGANFLKYSGTTGKAASGNTDFSIALPAPNRVVFTTTKPILPKQSFAISVAWPKGFVKIPTPFQQFTMKLWDNHFEWFVFFGSLILLVVYLILRPRIFKNQSN